MEKTNKNSKSCVFCDRPYYKTLVDLFTGKSRHEFNVCTKHYHNAKCMRCNKYMWKTIIKNHMQVRKHIRSFYLIDNKVDCESCALVIMNGKKKKMIKELEEKRNAKQN